MAGKLHLHVLDASSLGDDLDLSVLNPYGNVKIYSTTSPEEVPSHAEGADILLVNKVKLNRDNLAKSDRVRLICVFATGFDNIDIPYCQEKGIAVCNVVGYSSDSVSQVTVAMALSLMSHLREYNEFVRSGAYSRGNIANRLTPVYHEMAGKVWGIAGLGNIGRRVAAVAKALGCRVIAYKRTPDSEYPTVTLEELCRQSDILSLHLPLSSQTRGLIGETEIGLMKKDIVLVNASRGAITDEAAIAKALSEGRIGGFGTDVYSAEPFPEDHPLYAVKDNPNVLLTPHMMWGASEARERCLAEIVLNINSFLQGETRNRVDLL